MQLDDAPPWSYPIDVLTLPSDGFDVSLTPDDTVLNALAAWLDAQSISGLEVDVTLRRAGRYDVVLSGQMRATVTQACVVTLEPMTRNISHTVKRRYSTKGERQGLPEGGDIPSEPQLLSVEDDPPSWFDGATVDVGVCVCEELSLLIDPYPRKEGAVFADHIEDLDGDADVSPFAVLAQLKKNQ